MNLCPSNSIRGTLFFYHGIKFTQYECKNFQNLKEIINEQIMSCPITVRMDTFYCPWDKSYKKHHNKNHIFFINGIDYEQKRLYCTDPFYLIQDKKISFDNFINGYSNYYGLFEFEFDNSKSLDGRKIIQNLLISLFVNKTFDSIRLFAQELNKIISLSNELIGFHEAWQTPLYYNITAIANSRKRIPLLLLYIANNYNCNEFIDCIENFNSIILKWNSIKDLILKMFISDDFFELKKRLVIKLEDVANHEETVAKKLLDICKLIN